MYNLDSDIGYVEDCPKCRHSMQRLAQFNSIRRNEGYIIADDSSNDDAIIYVRFGWFMLAIRMLVREILVPIMTKLSGDRKQSRYDRILRAFPDSLICTHCRYVIRNPRATKPARRTRP